MGWLDLSNLDPASVLEMRTIFRDLDRFVIISCIDRKDAADNFFGLGKGTVCYAKLAS